MANTEHEALAARIETEGGVGDPALADAVRVAMAGLAGLTGFKPEDARSTDALLHAADTVLPGWHVSLHGSAREPDGHWRCTLRRSGSRDNDDFVGAGRGPVPSVALLAALLRTVGFLAARGELAR